MAGTQTSIAVTATSPIISLPNIPRTLDISILILHNDGDKNVYVGTDHIAEANKGFCIMPGASKVFTKGIPNYGITTSFRDLPNLYFVCKATESSSLSVWYL